MSYLDQHGFMPSDEWRTSGVHWHAYREDACDRPGSVASDRVRRLDANPETVLFTPDEVAQWLEKCARECAPESSGPELTSRDRIRVGDAKDAARLYSENLLVAARGDSVYTDVCFGEQKIYLYIEAVTNAECPGHG